MILDGKKYFKKAAIAALSNNAVMAARNALLRGTNVGLRNGTILYPHDLAIIIADMKTRNKYSIKT